MKILFVEDNLNYAEPVKRSLERVGYIVELETNGKEGYEKALINQYSVIILDINLPEMNGIDICLRLRKENIKIPILMLTASSAQVDKISGFTGGADDYVIKPVDLQELKLRLDALIRRSSMNTSVTLEAKDIQYYPESMKVVKNKKEIILSAKEGSILEYLLRNKGKVISSEELLENVWDSEVDLFTQTVKTHIKTLRKKIDPEKKIILTQKRVGYVIK